MDHYDEKMNYSFEPVAPETPQPPLEQAKEEIRRSGKHTGLKIAALLAALAIVAAVGGSGRQRSGTDFPAEFPVKQRHPEFQQNGNCQHNGSQRRKLYCLREQNLLERTLDQFCAD